MRKLAVVLALLLTATSVQPAQAAPVMSRFVVAIGGLSTGSSANWVRLANYSLTTSGTVTEWRAWGPGQAGPAQEKTPHRKPLKTPRTS